MLACGCEDLETVDWSRVQMRRARKEHQCCECRYTITPGQSYQVAVHQIEGQIYQTKTCERCVDLWDALVDLGFCRWMDGGMLEETYAEYLEEYVPMSDDEDEPVLDRDRADKVMKRHRGWAPEAPGRPEGHIGA